MSFMSFTTRLLNLLDDAETSVTNGEAASAHEDIGILCKENGVELRRMIEAWRSNSSSTPVRACVFPTRNEGE